MHTVCDRMCTRHIIVYLHRVCTPYMPIRVCTLYVTYDRKHGNFPAVNTAYDKTVCMVIFLL